MSGRRTGDRGSATVWVLVAAMAVVAFTAGLLLVLDAVAARARARTAADLAALAAVDGGCVTAAEIAGANGGSLRRCTVQDGVADVEVTVAPARLPMPIGVAVARARAGRR